MHWSKGLKKRFAIGEATEEELSAQLEGHAGMLGTVTIDKWSAVLAVDGSGTFLMLAANDGCDAVRMYLTGIRGRGIRFKQLPKLQDK